MQHQQAYGAYYHQQPIQQAYGTNGTSPFDVVNYSTTAAAASPPANQPNGLYGNYATQQQQQYNDAYQSHSSPAPQQQQQYVDPYNTYASPQQQPQHPMQPQLQQYQQQSAPLPLAQPAAPAPPATNCSDVNGLRWTWSTYPNTCRVKSKEHGTAASIPLPEMIVPMSCMYTPLTPLDPGAHMTYGDPQRLGYQCASCGSFMNVHSPREMGRFWECLSCLKRNPEPPNFVPQQPAMMNETVEYVLPPTYVQHPQQQQQQQLPKDLVFIFVIDVCVPQSELDAIKSNLLRCLEWLPSTALVGLISIGARTCVWELGASTFAKCYALRGERAYNGTEELARMLQVTDAQPVKGRLLVPLQECDFTFATLLDELQCDSAALPSTKRALRTTGTAVDAATFLVESLQAQMNPNKNTIRGVPPTGLVGTFGRILLFSGGPCTRGPGTIVSTDKADMMRFHRDIMEGNTPFYDAAFTFFNTIEERLSAVNTCLDVFAESFDQIGIMEMRNCVNNTGGTFVCGDAFSDDYFAASFTRYFDRCDLLRKAGGEAPSTPDATAGSSGHVASMSSVVSARTAFGVHIEVHTSADTLLSGILGPCNVDQKANQANKSHRAASPIQIGVSGSTRFCVSSVDQAVTLALLFDTATLDGEAGVKSPHAQASRFVQIVTRFCTADGEQRIRVTSITQPIAPANADPAYYIQGQAFDQTCASTVIARMAVSILEKFPSKWDDTKRWVDTLLVRFVRRYSTFTLGVADSVRLDPCISLFPSFMFNLRRSEYFIVLNISPDETTFKRHWLMREGVNNCVLMIQPTLDSYDLETPYATAVPLDSSSLRHDNIVLMDAFFNVHIMWGGTIFEWIKANYQENPEYAYFATLLENAEADAQAIVGARYPAPRFSRTDADGSEARHVKNRVNPATTYQSGPDGGARGAGYAGAPGDAPDMIYTDDASIMKFVASLKQAVVATDVKGPKDGKGGSGLH